MNKSKYTNSSFITHLIYFLTICEEGAGLQAVGRHSDDARPVPHFHGRALLALAVASFVADFASRRWCASRCIYLIVRLGDVLF